MRIVRQIDFLGRILAKGYFAEIQDNYNCSRLVVRNKSILSNSVSGLIKEEGYKFNYCYNDTNGESVFIFTKR